MEDEKLKIFDENGNERGAASRAEVHRKGYWHETFHCWITHFDEAAKETYIYFQLRSKGKKDYPGLLDITAAGHLLASETIEDGVRELHEELGLDIPFHLLQPLGKLKGELHQPGMIDREITHLFLYSKPVDYGEFHLQLEEVSGIFRSTLKDFKDLLLEVIEEIFVEGFEINGEGEKKFLGRKVGFHHFVPHEKSYLLEVHKRISQFL
ncbi:NUDIX hydrolase [Bacillus sp. KH172YL63]|uniref:NUDIX hydrolase n=1 Tax=Bacillus sp. KH172YL63 TaxID=2709784 RepID=UPI0013E5140B|nr:NUDIX domain-containing protein [Bacillus sp. KH172YL63]BCB03554.1 putative Nudix hydrolase [Bacillus sp. KH172YL63]